jgi:hypothetical protein
MREAIKYLDAERSAALMNAFKAGRIAEDVDGPHREAPENGPSGG